MAGFLDGSKEEGVGGPIAFGVVDVRDVANARMHTLLVYTRAHTTHTCSNHTCHTLARTLPFVFVIHNL